MTDLVHEISSWIKNYTIANGLETLVVGISGGIDSSVVSALCALTGLPTVAVSMPIRQRADLHDLSMRHGAWLAARFPNVRHEVIDLTTVFDRFETQLSAWPNQLAAANSRSRLRMVTLYQIAQSAQGLVVGTGNRVEDFGVGFFTKYGDGGVDISPIGSLYKTQVWQLGRELAVLPEIINAAPTDGLWDDGRTDQDQLGGLTYPELERAMHQDENGTEPVTEHERRALDLYRTIRAKTLHKMRPIPVFPLERNL